MVHFNIQSDTVLMLVGVTAVIYGTGLISNRTKSYHMKMSYNSVSQWLMAFLEPRLIGAHDLLTDKWAAKALL